MRIVCACASALLLLILGSLSSAADVSLLFSWDANPEKDLAGYKLYRSTVSGQYGAPLATIVGQTIHTSMIPQTEVAQTYYHVLKAINTSGQESRPTVEVSTVIPALPPPPPSVPASVPGLTIVSATSTEIVITATAADCPRVVTSTKGSTATMRKRTVRCVQ